MEFFYKYCGQFTTTFFRLSDNDLRMIDILVRLYILIILIVVFIASLLIGVRTAKYMGKFILWCFGIDVKVYGKVDPTARVVVFNHPQVLDASILNAVAGPMSGLIANVDWMSRLYATMLECVLVSRNGGTTEALLQKLREKPNLRYAVALHNHLDCTGGKQLGDKIETAKTIAFRLNEDVQPIVLVVDSSNCPVNDVSAPAFLGMPLNAQTRVRAYIMPKMRIANGEKAEDFAERTKGVMNRCLAKAWAASEAHALPIMDKTNAYTGLCFSLVAIACWAKGLYLYAAAWALLCVTSIIYHTSKNKAYKTVDRIAISIVVTMGWLHYTRLDKGHVFPVIMIIAVALIYYMGYNHTYVHLLSMLGHLSIIWNT
jgi:1-acyl-sn-glycerol-3-phosphate acyltransferase